MVGRVRRYGVDVSLIANLVAGAANQNVSIDGIGDRTSVWTDLFVFNMIWLPHFIQEGCHWDDASEPGWL